MNVQNLNKVLFVAFVAILAACGSKTSTEAERLAKLGSSNKNSIYGLWGGMSAIKDGDGNSVKFAMGFEESKVSAFVRCTYPDGSVLTSMVSTPAKITNDRVTIDTPAEHDERRDTKTCTAKLLRASFTYKVNGDLLTAESDGNLILSRLNSAEGF